MKQWLVNTLKKQHLDLDKRAEGVHSNRANQFHNALSNLVSSVQ